MNLVKGYNLVKQYGIKGILNRLVNRIYVKLYIYKVNLSNITLKQESNDLELVSMNINILNDMYNEYKTEISEVKYNILKKRLDEISTDKGYVVIDKKRNIYGYYHIAYKENLETTTNYLIADDTYNIYLFDDYTFINKRGNGVHKFSIYKRLKIGEKLGFKTATVGIVARNIYSEKSYYDFGFRKYMEVKHYNLKLLKKNVIKEL